MRQALIGLAAMGLAGCATTGGDTPPAQAEGGEGMTCDAAPVQARVGQQATEATGTAILKASGARTLRWGPPRSAWTMDYRQDRVNVQYDDAMKIVAITCG